MKNMIIGLIAILLLISSCSTKDIIQIKPIARIALKMPAGDRAFPDQFQAELKISGSGYIEKNIMVNVVWQSNLERHVVAQPVEVPLNQELLIRIQANVNNGIYIGEISAYLSEEYMSELVVNMTEQMVSEMILVPGGTFTMGDTRGGGVSDELPTHSVTLTSFYIGKYEVTQAEYAQYMQPSSSWTSNYGLGDNYPAYYVSWYAILKYCNLRSINEGLTPVYTISGSTNPANWGSVPTSNNATWNAATCNWNANGYRLPTEAEWEYAARGGSPSPDYIYSGSNDINSVAWYSGNSGSTTHPVGTLAYNGLSLCDMSGNVWEWCWDWYGAYGAEGQINPTGPQTGSYRLLRGGDWAGDAAGCRVSVRGIDIPYLSLGDNGGFRLCRAIN